MKCFTEAQLNEILWAVYEMGGEDEWRIDRIDPPPKEETEQRFKEVVEKVEAQ